MDRKSKLREIALAACIVLGALQGVDAQALENSGASSPVVSQPGATTALPDASQSGQAETTALTPDENRQSATGNVAELQQMIHGSELSELRTTYNGTYGASMMFYGKEMTYYIALFQQKNFWRVIKTQDIVRAELIYKDFVRQTVQLSDVEIRRTQLEAQKAFTQRMIALSQERASRLQADLDIARQQQSIVANQQEQKRAEATELAQQKAAAQDQLRVAQRQVRDLQRQLDSGLPLH
ncbi:putative signal peptide protein [Burkholderia sp. H160]|nr:putative signal peptide protein [Burkholderia sp. H160]